MVSNRVIDNLCQYLNEYGEERGLAEFWWEDFGDEDEDEPYTKAMTFWRKTDSV